MSENRVIGRDGGLPWHLSDDLRRFKRLTMGHHVIFGRRTFETLGRPLPGRSLIVLTRRTATQWPGVQTATDLTQAFQCAQSDPEVFVAGGGEIYAAALALVDRLYVTLVHADVTGDTWFPEVDWSQWDVVEESRHAADERNTWESTFRIYQRRAPV